jgi:DNA polymerase III subunit gamma/tau
MNEVQLNLARKWRSKQFEQIVGQDLSVRILKNSLFLGKFFPVYLFAGQHGCGKTTTARVFAAAVNCERLPDFQQNPKKFVVPCLECDSCKAMLQGRHPDFIEMDAASHTGVDNVRQVIEASTLLPLLGRRKVYLIDEAHMLSKAAFNAFLKILEEPPSSVFFILATTDDHKIIDTVRSRCFQLFFNAVEQNSLLSHLKHICEAESIAYDPDGLALIIKETGGSVRDALNLLEQVGFSAKKIGKKEVLSVLGHLSDDIFLNLLTCLFKEDSLDKLIIFIEKIDFSSYNVEYIWKRFLYLLRVLVWVKHDVKPSDFLGDLRAYRELVSSVQLVSLMNAFDFVCSQEHVFVRTIHKTSFLQLFFVRIWQMIHQGDVVALNSSIKSSLPQEVEKKRVDSTSVKTKEVKEGKKEGEGKKKEELSDSKKEDVGEWDRFIVSVELKDEPLLCSIFKQAHYEKSGNTISLHFSSRLRLFQDTLDQMRNLWLPELQRVFGVDIKIATFFDKAVTIQENEKKKIPVKSAQSSAPVYRSSYVRREDGVIGRAIDVSDRDQWPLTNQLLEFFPGKVVELPQPKQEQGNE